MLRKILIGILLGVLLLSAGIWVWARIVLGADGVRTAVAAQLTRALGQPVSIGGVGATIFPRVTLRLDEVTIGAPARITADRLLVGASLRALLSRRIEQASLRLTGARIELPLPAFAFATADGPANAASPDTGTPASRPIEIVSVEEILVRDAVIVSGGRTLLADLEIVPGPTGLAIRRLDLTADGEAMHITGQITDLTAPAATLNVTAGTIGFDALILFVTDFARGAGLAGDDPLEAGSASDAPVGTVAMSAMDVDVTIDADAATFGALRIADLAGHARITSTAWTFDAVRFGLFGGEYEGALTLSLEDTPAFRLNAALLDVDMGAVTTFAGHPGAITGRLSGTLDVYGRGLDAHAALQSARGSARVDLVDGIVRNLGLVRAIVLAGSMRDESRAAAREVPNDEAFSRLGATLALAGGTARTGDLRFESPDLLLEADGTLALDGSDLDLEGEIRLSEALTRQAGRDLVRYTQEGGRVTLPITISGSIADYEIGIDLADLTRRAIINRATEEAEEAIRRGLGGLIGR
jgi:uncharacterized protein involved in outer membrane biogenesis